MSNGESAPAPETRPPADVPPRDAGFRERLFRAITFVAVVGSVAVICWSYFGLLAPRLKQSRQLSSEVARLSAEVDGLERQWTDADAQQMSNKFSQVGSQLFTGQAGLVAWLANAKAQAAPLALDLWAELGQAASPTAGGRTFTVIPATVSVEVQPARAEAGIVSPYQRIVRVSQRLAGGDQRADLAELTVSKGANSIGRAVLVLNCWTEKEAAP
jgi:hypothetical protein